MSFVLFPRIARRGTFRESVHTLMKAFLLAAGLGTRLRPLTESIPKCLVRVSGRPLLFHWLDLLEREKVREVLINTHYHSPAVLDAIAPFRTNLKIEVFHEP